jgi:hypothetical protein
MADERSDRVVEYEIRSIIPAPANLYAVFVVSGAPPNVLAHPVIALALVTISDHGTLIDQIEAVVAREGDVQLAIESSQYARTQYGPRIDRWGCDETTKGRSETWINDPPAIARARRNAHCD